MTRSFDEFGQNKPAFFYFYDALCGWCYGFSPVIHQLYQQFESKMDFEVISGGMITGDRVGRIGEVAGYISEAYRTVEERTGVTFGPDFLKGTLADGKAVFTSVPAAVAMAIAKEQAPDRQVEFARLLQQAVYFDGIPPAEAQGYAPYAEQIGMDGPSFTTMMKDLAYRQKAEEEFQITAKIGVRGFPTCFMKTGDQFHLIATGFRPLPEMLAAVQTVLNQPSVNPN